MGDFRIVINAVGGHGQDREKKDGERVNFAEGGEATPENLARTFIRNLQAHGCSIESASVVHWPLDNYGGPEKNGRTTEIKDDLLTGIRSGSF